MAARTDKIEVLNNEDGAAWWHYRNRNGKVECASEMFTSTRSVHEARRAARRAAERMSKRIVTEPVVLDVVTPLAAT